MSAPRPGLRPRARLRALLGRITMVAASVAPAPALASPAAADARREPCLSCDDEARQAGAHSLAITLSHLPPLEAVAHAADLALAVEPSRRLTLASALAWTFPLVGDSVIIDHLSRDPAPPIRTAAARAAWARRATGGDAGVLDRLAEDPSPDVREVANLALRG